jgi:hypothetical protein
VVVERGWWIPREHQRKRVGEVDVFGYQTSREGKKKEE